jgi:hypothetical protein
MRRNTHSNTASTDLCGGRQVTGVPTATAEVALRRGDTVMMIRGVVDESVLRMVLRELLQSSATLLICAEASMVWLP